MTLFRGLLAVSILGVFASAIRADVHRVGVGGFATPQDAIDAASDGDVILIDAGVYPGFVIDDKELFVAASQTVFPVRVGASYIQNLGAAKAVVLADLRFVSITFDEALQLASCAGAVRVQRCLMRIDPDSEAPGFAVTSSPNVVMVECELRGGSQSSGARQAGVGALLRDSRLALHRSSATGGSAGAATNWIPCCATGRGGSGLEADGSFLYSNDSMLQGGVGGGLSLLPTVCQNSSNFQDLGRGGHGASFAGLSPSQSWFTRPQLLRGPYGASNCSFAFNEWPPSKDFVRGPAGSAAGRVGGGLARHMTLASLAVGANPAAATFAGAPGESVHVVLSLAPDFVWSSGMVGVVGVALAGALPPQLVGQLDAAGSLSSAVALPPLPVGSPNRTWHAQSYFTSPAGSVRLGPSSCVAQLP